ncbi:hypothetical protein [Bullifex porci]|uniref:hypothetical protein n=1 Tax=Bullifex porci TaxID=2606638 RepID=UPI0023F01186|nr:hypothetical protein [Bullifex porci]MDD7588075.1 hypothetical protein [Bullifex porci]
MVKDGRVVYLSEKSKQLDYWNIPIANTTVIILGTGTSITNSAGVLIRKIEIGEDKALARLKGII